MTKSQLSILFLLLLQTSTFGQGLQVKCEDTAIIEYQGSISDLTALNPLMQISDSLMPSIGDQGELAKKTKSKIEGQTQANWLVLKKVEVIALIGHKVTFKILDSLSNSTLENPKITPENTVEVVKFSQFTYETPQEVSVLENGKISETYFKACGKRFGPSKIYFPNGQLKETSNFNIQEKKDGPSETYYENGQIESKTVYADGRLQGTAFFYHENGELYTTGIYDEEGRKDGEWSEYDNDGKLQTQINFKNGMKHGVHTVFFPNGSLKSIGNYENGDYVGKWLQYYENGVLEDEGIYEEGSNDFHYKHYFESGILSETGTMVRFSKEGIVKTYYETGVLQTSVTYKEGSQEGPFETYYPSGQLGSKGTFSYRNKVGKYERFHEDGGIWVIAHFSKTGPSDWKSYYPNGQLEEEGHLDNYERKTGLWKSYYENGIQHWEITFLGNVSVGKSKGWFENGKIKFVDSRNKLGNPHGLFASYYENGQLKNKVRFNAQSEKTGHYKSFYENGKQHESGNYAADEKIGKWVIFDEKGKKEIIEY